jgi:hypothetical protein
MVSRMLKPVKLGFHRRRWQPRPLQPILIFPDQSIHSEMLFGILDRPVALKGCLQPMLLICVSTKNVPRFLVGKRFKKLDCPSGGPEFSLLDSQDLSSQDTAPSA